MRVNCQRVNTYSTHPAEIPTASGAVCPGVCAPSIIRNIEHLQIRVDILLLSGSFQDVNDLHRIIWDGKMIEVSRTLADVFPNLRDLDVQVGNYDMADVDELVYVVDGLRHMSDCRHFEGYTKMERMLRMQVILLLVGVVKGPRLARKSVTFIQRPTGSDHYEIDPFQPLVKVVCEPTPRLKARVGLLFCEMRGLPHTEANTSWHGAGRGKRDRVCLESVLRKARVVVKL